VRERDTSRRVDVLLQVIDLLPLKHHLDLPGSGQVKRLDGVLPIPDITPLDSDRFEHRPEDIGLERGVRHTVADEGPARTEVLDRLGVGRLMSGDDEGGVGTKAAGAGFLDIVDEVLPRLLEVDEDRRAEGFRELLLCISGIDRNDVETDGFGVLDGEVTETATCTGDDDPVADLGVGSFKSSVGSHSSA